MKATATNLLKFLQGTKQFVIPIYQRTYSWEQSDCLQLWNDILRVAQDDTIPAHFVGSIVYVEKGIYHVSSVTQLLVIDGQQRLTTLSLLLAVLGEALEEPAREHNGEITRKKIYNYYLLNAEEEGDIHYKLLLTQSDRETLINILEGREQHAAFSLRVMQNYQFFKEQVRQSGIDPVTLYKGISKLIVVDISLEQQDNPQLIFESLNSTGMDLSQADLIRNYVLMGLDNDEQTRLYRSYWYPMEHSFGHAQNVALFNRFMRDYLTMQSKSGEIPNIDKVYVTFKTYQQGRNEAPIADIVADIYRYSRYFTKMALAQEQDTAIKQVIDDINRLQVYVAYPFLLEVYDDYEHQLLTRDDFIAILKLIESYVFRRAICGIPTNALNKIFATLAKEISKEHYLESVQTAFLQKRAGGRFPRDEEFRAEFVVKNMYNFRSRNYLLSKLENYERKEQVNIEEYTIEHILPQNEHLSHEWQQELGANWKEIQALYLHTIGNLTLTGYNPELSDRPFQQKRDMDGGFADSPVRLNRSLAKLEHWNEREIQRRAQTLADLAIKIWPLPQLTVGLVDQFSRQTYREPLAEVIGPIDHPLGGFIPEGFKVVQLTAKKFHSYRLVGGKWVQYGNGKVPWFATSWGNMGWRLRYYDKKGIMPFGAGGAVHPYFLKSGDAGILAEDNDLADADENNLYTLDSYQYLQGDMLELFERLRKRILNLDSSVREEYKKLYIAYKTTTNFVDIEPQKNQLRLFLNMKFSEIHDPWGYCRDVTTVGHHGNGDVEASISSSDQLDDLMDLVRQSFEKHWEEAYA